VKNLAAYTAGASYYPAYLSINEAGHGDDYVHVSIRSEALPEGGCGPLASVLIPRTVFKQLLLDALKEIE
jgi:hypothetical protein